MGSSSAAIILAGGKSSRMGKDKGLLLLHGKPFISHIIDACTAITEQVILVTNTPAAYAFTGLLTVTDHFGGKGPVDGIFSGMHAQQAGLYFVLSCDMPLVTASLLLALDNNYTNKGILLPKLDEEHFYFPGIYPLQVIEKAEYLLVRASTACKKQPEVSMKNLISGFEVNFLPMDELSVPKESFRNFNTPNDLEY